MWNDLSLAQKSKVMRMAIDNGVRNYDDIKLLYEEASHKFKDGGPKKNNNKSLTEQGVFDMHRSDAQMIIDPLRYNGNPESIVDWDAVNINNTGSMHYDLDNITITAPETKKPEPEVIEKEVPVFIPSDDDYRSNRTKRKLKSYTFEEPKKAKDSLVPITPMFMDTPYSDELQGKVNGEYVYDLPNLFPDGGTLDGNDPDIPMYGSTTQEAVVTGHRMPKLTRFLNKTFRSKSGWDKYVDRYYARQQHLKDTNNTPNPTYEVSDALSTAGIIAGTPYNEDIERTKVWDTYNNWKEHNEIIGPHYDPDGNYHNDAYANPSAGYLSNTDPVGEFFVLNEALGPLAKFVGRGAQQVMARAGNQWARNQVMGRAFNNAADASFGFNNRFVATPASSLGYEIKPNIRTKIGDVEINNPNLMYHTDLGDGLGQFNHIGASIENGNLIPGLARIQGQEAYTWWNLGKPYSDPKVRLITTSKYNPDLIHVRSADYPIGQWPGKNGKSFVLNTEYVAEKPIDVAESTYLYDPSYGYRKTTPTTNSAKTSLKFYEKPSKLTYEEWTPEQWTAAQDAAIARGDMAEAQRLKDLHFKIKTVDNKIYKPEGWHQTNTNFNIFDLKKTNNKNRDAFAITGVYTKNTDADILGTQYPIQMHVNRYTKNPLVINTKTDLLDIIPGLKNSTQELENIVNTKRNLIDILKERSDPNTTAIRKIEINKQIHAFNKDYEQKILKAINNNKTIIDKYLKDNNYDAVLINKDYSGDGLYNFGNYTDTEILLSPNQIKSADAVTYDDNGIRIPLGERDNFNINDKRYGLAPLGFGIPYLMNNNNQ